MKRNEVCALVREIGIVPAVKVSSGEDAHFAVESIAQGGIPIVEITMTVAGAVELISHLVKHHPKMVVGAGTVLDMETAKACIDAGASFLTAPGFDASILELGAKDDVAVLPGALTPTEIVTAWKAGADFVKVFPCGPVGGDKYVKSITTSLTNVPILAAGGVNQQTALNFILSGATAIGVGTQLIPTEAIARRQSARIRELASRFLGYVKEARERLETARKNAVAAEKYAEKERCET